MHSTCTCTYIYVLYEKLTNQHSIEALAAAENFIELYSTQKDQLLMENDFLKGHSQLMHMPIRYHFLAYLHLIICYMHMKIFLLYMHNISFIFIYVIYLLHVTRHAWNRKWEAYPKYSKQTLTSYSSFYIPLRIHRWIFPGKAKHQRKLPNWTPVKVRNCTKSKWLSKVQGREILIFKIYVTFPIDFPNIYSDYLLANVTDSFLLLFW